MTAVLCGAVLGSAWTYANYAERPDAEVLIAKAAERGVDAEWARSLIASAERKQSILDAIARPAEKTKPWHEYRDIFLTQRRIEGGVAFAREHRDTLIKVAERTGVPVEMIVAIIGVETFYGRITGSYRVIDALATLAFDYPKRSPFFSGELVNFLVLASQSGKDPLALKGSYAGAMGYGQFMPSSYLSYAVDFDDDGVTDIWDNPKDAIYSVANYFLAHGWKPGDPVVVRADASAPDDALFDGELKPRRTIGDLVTAGLAPTEPLFTDLVATPLRLEGQQGPEYWLGLDNFYVITRYNHSAMYALAAWQLAEAIAAELAQP
ncbi:MAG: lytic murein transglycosylase B [Halieaceae bacterium]|jgi:membrane-bound lytic murein transglycosylase B|nr:lytic murein transglycosylase B [Halieaceae bacterium]